MKRIKYFILPLLVLSIFLTQTNQHKANAYYQSGNNITLPQNNTINETTFVAGSNIDISSSINGDLYCAGQTINITGTVNGDIFCAGQTISINGVVNGNIRAAGQIVNITNKVSRNVSFLAQTFSLSSSAVIGQDLSGVGQTIDIKGTITRDINGLAARDANISGTVGRNVDFDRINKLTIGSSALIGGNLYYWSNNNANILNPSSVRGSNQRYTPIKSEERNNVTEGFISNSASVIFSILSSLLIGILLVLFLRKPTERVIDSLQNNPRGSLGFGLLFLFVLPIILLLVIFTIIGIPLAIIGFAIWIIAIFISRIFVAILFGKLVWERFIKRTTNFELLTYAIVGILLSYLIFEIPLLGGLLSFVAIIYGLGGMIEAFRHKEIPIIETA